jgi:hypothetical protein
MEKKCHFCGEILQLTDVVGRLDTCPKCKHDLHSCLQCRFYDEKAYHQCREPQADWVSDKEKGNFCDYFEFGKEVKKEKEQDPRAKLEALFKKK